MLRPLLPPAVRVVEVDREAAAGEAGAWPQELAAVAAARPERRREFFTGRWCARAALLLLGCDPVALPPGPRRAPVWPEGFVGSITHCPGYRAAAVARRAEVAALGVDATPHEPLPAGVLELVADAGERAQLRALAARLPGVHADRVLFSAKESLLKAWSALDGGWPGFSGFRVRLHPCGEFSAEVLAAGPVAALTGRWGLEGALAGTAVAVPASTVPEATAPQAGEPAQRVPHSR
ncbi:4'-phosphopantetheinyl transferase superfamily protein [Kineococcus sp. T90]|nr:4'-phosphopantetheinyl transferase superfamily protein [Kineococcus indalonis]